MSYVDFNESFFDDILQSSEVEALCESKAKQALAIAKAKAPFKTGDYRNGLAIEVGRSAHRKVFRVVGHSRHTLLVEAKTGNLARAIKAVR